MTRILTRFALLLGLSLLALSAAAWAAKASVVAKIAGSAYVLRADPSSSWLAAWSKQANGKYTLMVVDGEKGERREVVTVDKPGGLCWIPTRQRLLYCKGVYNDKVKSTRVTYYYYDLKTSETKKIYELTDALDTYQLDPVAAEDGSLVFILTIDTRSIPSFNIYYPDANLLSPMLVDANIGAEFDLSSDGSTVYWYLHNPDSGDFGVIAWDLAKNTYASLHEFTAAQDPADDHALFKVDSPHLQAATVCYSETDPTLQLCVYGFSNPSKLTIAPVKLAQGEDVIYYDWKGRTGMLYMLTKNSKTGAYSISEIEPLTGMKTVLLSGKDEIAWVDYSPKTQTYFYSVVDSRNPNNPLTALVRLR